MEDGGTTTVPIGKPHTVADKTARARHTVFIHAVLCPHLDQAGIPSAATFAAGGEDRGGGSGHIAGTARR